MQPTKERNHSAVFLEFEGEGILLDCGENTQRQMRIAGISTTAVTRIFITHWHGDHVLGIPGLMQSMAANGYNKSLKIYGPKGTKDRFTHLLKAFVFDNHLDFEIFEVHSGIACDVEKFYVECAELDHSIMCLGYSFVEKDTRKIKVSFVRSLGIPDGPLLGKLQKGHKIEWKGETIKPEDATFTKKGKKITYITDTGKCKAAVELAKDSDLLISESAYATSLGEKAEEYKHLTASDAAHIAALAGAKKLVLTHFSQRYTNTDELLENAKQIFPDVECAFDFFKTKV